MISLLAPNPAAQHVIGNRSRVGDPFQGLAEHMPRLHRDAEQRGSHLGDRDSLAVRVTLGRHRCRCADALDRSGVADVAQPASQQRDIGALAAAVGVQLVKDQELQAASGLDQAPLASAASKSRIASAGVGGSAISAVFLGTVASRARFSLIHRHLTAKLSARRKME